MDIKSLKRENQNIREILNRLERDRKEIAGDLSEDYDYYSFLRGMDYVIDKLKNELNKN